MATKTYAKCRDYNKGESFPYVEVNDPIADNYKEYPCDETLYECWQPDHLDDAEFNLIILLEDRPVVARSWHFDFL